MNYYNNNQQNDISVNTTFMQSYGVDSLLTVGAWNNNISLKFHPIENAGGNGFSRTYKKEKEFIVSISLVSDNVIALLDGIEKVILPASIKNEPATVTVTSGNQSASKTLSISTENGAFYAVASTFTEGKPVTSITHTFNTRSYTANGNEVVVPTGFINFVKKLECIFTIVPDKVHATKYADAVAKSMQNKYSSSNSSYASAAPRAEAVTTGSVMESIDNFLPFDNN